MNISPAAGKLPAPSLLLNMPKHVTAYYVEAPDPADGVGRDVAEDG